MKYRIAIVGYGNIGRFALEAVEAAADFVLAGVVRRASSLGKIPPELRDYPVAGSIGELGKVDVALLCVPSRSVPEYAREILAAGINTVDSYDIHGELVRLKKELTRWPGSTTVFPSSPPADPGTDSMIRAILNSWLPRVLLIPISPGMSMGHTVAVKAIPGVKCPVHDDPGGRGRPPAHGLCRIGGGGGV